MQIPLPGEWSGKRDEGLGSASLTGPTAPAAPLAAATSLATTAVATAATTVAAELLHPSHLLQQPVRTLAVVNLGAAAQR